MLASSEHGVSVCMSVYNALHSSLNRVLEPYIMMEMTLSSGEIKTFEVCAHFLLD